MRVVTEPRINVDIFYYSYNMAYNKVVDEYCLNPPPFFVLEELLF